MKIYFNQVFKKWTAMALWKKKNISTKKIIKFYIASIGIFKISIRKLGELQKYPKHRKICSEFYFNIAKFIFSSGYASYKNVQRLAGE